MVSASNVEDVWLVVIQKQYENQSNHILLAEVQTVGTLDEIMEVCDPHIPTALLAEDLASTIQRGNGEFQWDRFFPRVIKITSTRYRRLIEEPST